jgi:hypothetical protein
MSNEYAALRSHFEKVWPGHAKEEFLWTLGPISATLPNFRVCRIAPSKPNEPWVYLSMGAWEATKGQADGLEFFILSPDETPRHIETLSMMANLHADPKYRRSIGDVVEIGRPWLEGSRATKLLLSLPYPYGPALEWCVIDVRRIRFLWLFPIFDSEYTYFKAHGQEALEKLFDLNHVNYLQGNRRPVI